MAYHIRAIHLDLNPMVNNEYIGRVWFFRHDDRKCSNHTIVRNSPRYARAIRAQMALIDPRTRAERAADEMASDVIETQNDVRPY
jgi:hypothetical protein